MYSVTLFNLNCHIDIGDSEQNTPLQFVSFELHSSDVINKDNYVRVCVSRAFEYQPKQMILTFYRSLVQPQTEQHLEIVKPYPQNYIGALETIQETSDRLD